MSKAIKEQVSKVSTGVNTKRCKLSLTKNQLALLTEALFEYSSICEDGSLGRDGSRCPLFEVSKDLNKLLFSVNKQMQKQGFF